MGELEIAEKVGGMAMMARFRKANQNMRLVLSVGTGSLRRKEV